MAKLKRLATQADPIAQIECPVSKEELDSRVRDYPVLEPLKFAREHDGLLFQPVTLTINSQSHQIQFNHCTNPFCKWFGHSQVRFENAPNKPHRYKIVGSQKYGNQAIACNPDPLNTTYCVSLDCTSTPVSNWSVAEEIAV